MSNNQLFFALAGLILAINGLSAGFLKYYIDAKIDGTASKEAVAVLGGNLGAKIDSLGTKFDGLNAKVDQLVQYMILHEGKIAALEERTKKL